MSNSLLYGQSQKTLDFQATNNDITEIQREVVNVGLPNIYSSV